MMFFLSDQDKGQLGSIDVIYIILCIYNIAIYHCMVWYTWTRRLVRTRTKLGHGPEAKIGCDMVRRYHLNTRCLSYELRGPVFQTN